MLLKSTFLFKWARALYGAVIRMVCKMRRRPYVRDVEDIISGICGGGSSQDHKSLSIISSNCFAGRIMQDLNMEYNSPTLGLYFMYPDYIEFLRNLRYYLTEAEIRFVEHSKYPLGDERRARWSHWYPIGLLDGKVEIHFLHYHSEQEAAEKWYRRAARVDFDNLLIIGMDQNLCTEADVRAFDSLPFERKIMFSRYDFPLASNEYMPEFAGCDSVGDAYRKGHIFYRHLIGHFKAQRP